MPICFDLDGTLGTFGGGYVLLREVLGEVWGSPPMPEELRACRGSTDWEIIDELHRLRFGCGLENQTYQEFEIVCLARFRSTFHPEGKLPVAFQGIIEGLHQLVARGHSVWLVSGNVPLVLDFKAQALSIDERVHRLGSLPGCSRADLIRRAMLDSTSPHLYVGDRPHDQEAAEAAGVPFLCIGDAVPGDHPILSIDTGAEQLIEMVERLVGRS
ncbi:MAG: HAD hydrolase-like protein [Holophagaceae bacterium]|nr:HAD hydrolase-like protein [Holophagaceae bacterium]